jgi:alkanesulfonate monooxygenase
MPVEINGLLNHNLSSELSPIPVSHFDLDAVRLQARVHEEGGYDRVLIANAATMPDNITIASYVAGITKRLGFMLAHRPGFIAPTMAARVLATLEQLSHGRLAVHIISAASDVETQADGDFLTKDERYRRSHEYIGVLRDIWSNAAPIDHEGDWFRFRGGFGEVKPYQKSGPPIYWGGMSPLALEIGAECADVYATLSDTLDGMRQVVQTVREAASPHGRYPRFLMSIRIVLGDTEAAAWRNAAEIEAGVAARMPARKAEGAPPVAAGFQRQEETAAKGDRLDRCFWNGINKLRGGVSNSGALVGAPDQIVEALMDYYDLGVSAFILRGFDPIEDAKRIGREVIAPLRAAVAARDALAA